MLPRLLEPEVMDSAEEARDYDAMDHGTVNGVFVKDLLDLHPDTRLILDVGTGTAQIPIALCRQTADVHIVGIDRAVQMLLVGNANVLRAGLPARIQLEACDAKRMPFADGQFSAVISNSIVHHIPQPPDVLSEMIRVAAPGGIVFVRDLLRPENHAQAERLVQMYAGTANQHQQKMFRDSLHAALNLSEMAALVKDLDCSSSTLRQTSDRHWTWTATKQGLRHKAPE